VMLPLLMLVDVWTLKPFWRRWDWPNSKVLIVGGALGVVLAAWLYKTIEADMLRVLIGLISIGFVLYQLSTRLGLLRLREHPFRPGLGIFVGVVSGAASFISHAGGPPVAMFLLTQKIGKTTYQATTVLVFWIVNIFKFIPYAFLGIFTWETLLADLYLAPVAILGAALGIYAHRRVPEPVFFAITYILLVSAGGKLLYDGLT
ncbi:MAG: sulfite exporter TauE/SafE family protein, partial [Litoreibacter sp.]|nr:sulfite exporter TauE/SafE family protein [Litoreibacter sp.]